MSCEIGADNQATLEAFGTDMRSPGHYLAREILRQENMVQKRGGAKKSTLTLRWTTGHDGQRDSRVSRPQLYLSQFPERSEDIWRGIQVIRTKGVHCERSELSLAKSERPGQTNTNCVTQMLLVSVKILIAVYLSHLHIFSYKNLRLCRESMILLECHKKLELCVYIKEFKGT
jgi:hypothetical protein